MQLRIGDIVLEGTQEELVQYERLSGQLELESEKARRDSSQIAGELGRAVKRAMNVISARSQANGMGV